MKRILIAQSLDGPACASNRDARLVRRRQPSGKGTGMNIRSIMAAGMAACVAVAAFSDSRADETFEYATVGAWQIRVDPTLGATCFMMAEFVDGSVLRVGHEESVVHVILGNPNWRSIEYGRVYPIELAVGDREPWSGDSVGFSFDPPESQAFLRMDIESDLSNDFLTQVMQERFMVVRYAGKEILQLSLDGSFRATLKMAECQREVDKYRPDPFEDAATGQDDPFAY